MVVERALEDPDLNPGHRRPWASRLVGPLLLSSVK